MKPFDITQGVFCVLGLISRYGPLVHVAICVVCDIIVMRGNNVHLSPLIGAE